MDKAAKKRSASPQLARLVAGGLAGAVMVSGLQITLGATQARAFGSCDYRKQTYERLALEGARLMDEGKEEEGLAKLERSGYWVASWKECLRAQQEGEEKDKWGFSVSPADTGSRAVPAPAPAPNQPEPGAPNTSAAPEAAKDPQLDLDLHRQQVPLAYGQGAFDERLQEAMDTAVFMGDFNEAAIAALANDVAQAELDRFGSLQVAIQDASYRISVLSDPAKLVVKNNRALLELNRKMLAYYVALESPIVGTVADNAKSALVTVTPRKTKRGAKVLNSQISENGRMSATVATRLKKGSTARVEVRYKDPGFGDWKTEASKVEVGKGGAVKFSADVGKHNYIYLRDTKGKMLVRWTTS